MSENEEIVIIGSFDQNRKCIGVDGQGQSTMTVTLDATQLANLLKSFAQFKECLFELRMTPLTGEPLHGTDKNTPDELPCEG